MITPISVLEAAPPTKPSTIHHPHHHHHHYNNNHHSQSVSLVKCWTERENSPVFTSTTINTSNIIIIASCQSSKTNKSVDQSKLS